VSKKTKDSDTLFELITQAREASAGTFDVPAWMEKRRAQALPSAPPEAQDKAETKLAEAEAAPQAPPEPAPPAVPPVPAEPAEQAAPPAQPRVAAPRRAEAEKTSQAEVDYEAQAVAAAHAAAEAQTARQAQAAAAAQAARKAAQVAAAEAAKQARHAERQPAPQPRRTAQGPAAAPASGAPRPQAQHPQAVRPAEKIRRPPWQRPEQQEIQLATAEATLPSRRQILLWALLAALAFMTFVIGFFAGRMTAPEPPPAKPPGRTELSTDAAPRAPQRTPGKYYLVIQQLQGGAQADHTEADLIVEFCAKHNTPADIQQTRSGKYVVWSLTSFDSPRSAEALAFAQKIEELGKEYFSRNRTYRFQQRTSPSAPLDPWFQQEPAD